MYLIDVNIGAYTNMYFFGLPYLNSNEVPDEFTEITSIAHCRIMG